MTEQPSPGALLRKARERQPLSIRAVAKRAGVSDTLWRNVEAGTRTRPNSLIAMARAVGADVRQVLDAAGFQDVEIPPIEAAPEKAPTPLPVWHPPGTAQKMTLRQRRVVEAMILLLTDDREATESNEKEIVPVETGLPATVTALVDDVDARRGDIEQIVARVLREMAEEGRQTGR